MFNSNHAQLYFPLKNNLKNNVITKRLTENYFKNISQTDFFIRLFLEFNLTHISKYNLKYIFYITFIYNE